MSALLAGAYERKNEAVGLVNFKKGNVRKVILDDFSRTLAWTGMLATRVEDSLDDEEEPHRTFDFHTDDLLR